MGEENNSVIVKKVEFMKTFLTKTGPIPARRPVGDERPLLYTFVIVKTKKVLMGALVLEGCLGALEPRSSFKIP